MKSLQQQEQQELSFCNFVRNVEKLIKCLEKEYTPYSLEDNCELVCCHSCTDGYESEICNMHKWIPLLIKAKPLIPDENLVTFLTYLISGNGRRFAKIYMSRLHRIFLRLFHISYCNFEFAKSDILAHLESGKGFIDFKDEPKTYAALWADILWEAESLDIIPGGNVVDFLNFIS